MDKVEMDLIEGNINRAISRLEGHLEHQPFNDKILDKLASLLLASGKVAKAGRYWYLVPSEKSRQAEAVDAFERSYGADPILILRKLIKSNRFPLAKLGDEQLLILEDLLLRVKQRESSLPNFLRPLENELTKRKTLKRSS